MIKVNDEMGLNWLVPTHGKYWHRRFRGIAIQGWYYTYTTCMGIEHAEDQFAEKGEATIENAMRLRGVLEGEQQCPICGKEQDECNCTCNPEYRIDGYMMSCGQRCAVGRIWPPCVACRSCGSCCRCSHNRPHQMPITQQEAGRVANTSQTQADWIRDAANVGPHQPPPAPPAPPAPQGTAEMPSQV